MGTDPSSDLAMVFAEISRALWSAPTIQDTLQRIVDFSVETIDGCDGAGISFIMGDTITTPVWTNPTVVDIDTQQYSTGEGPCLDAIGKELSYYSEDLASDKRWPVFGPRAAEAGMRSLLSFRLFGSSTLGALNLYAHSPSAYSVEDRAKGLIFATHAGIALDAAQTVAGMTEALAVETKRLSDLKGALDSREIIGQAEGVLMERELISSDEAFRLLREASQHLNIKLRRVAQLLVDTGQFPQERQVGPEGTSRPPGAQRPR